jgi:hypothetical protein
MADFWNMLTDAFTGAPQQQAAQQQQNAVAGQNAQTAANLAAAQAGGIDALKSGQYSGNQAIINALQNASNYITTYYPQAANTVQNYYNTGVNALTGAQSNALSALQSGLSNATGAWQPVLDAASRYGAAGNTALTAAFNALGLNGPGGNAAATAMFQSSPGYQFALGQGLNAVARGANAAGMAASGNELQASQKFGQGLADQDWQTWLNNVTGQEKFLLPMEQSGLTSYAQGVAPLFSNFGTNAANLYTGTASKLADLASGAGTSLSSLYTGAGKTLSDLSSQGGLNLASLFSGTGGNIAQLLQALSGQQTNFSAQSLKDLLGTYDTAANAQTAGSSNLWNAIGGAAKLAAAIPTGGLSLLVPTPQIGASSTQYPQAVNRS